MTQLDRGESFEAGQSESEWAKETTKETQKWNLGVPALLVASLMFGFCAGATSDRLLEPAHNLTLVISPSESNEGAPHFNEECPGSIVEPVGDRAQVINARR